MKPIRLMAVLLVTVLAGCDELVTALEELGGSATLVVANHSSTPVFFMYISPCSSGSWGSDQLAADEIIQSGASRRWTLDAGCYSVRAEFSDSGYAEDRLQLESQMEFTWRLTD